MGDYVGRGAWPVSGAGGTLTRDRLTKGTKPGRFYMLAAKADGTVDQSKYVGRAAWTALRAGTPTDLNEFAAHLAVKAIQTQLVAGGFTARDGSALRVDGVFGRNVDHAVRLFQAAKGLTVDGVFGSASARAMFHPLMAAAAGGRGVPVDLLCGTVTYESGVDPGAVGVQDADDLGMGQLNVRAHPALTIEDRFNPSLALAYVAGIIRGNLDAFPNQDDAIAAYNLGRAGCNAWIAAGRPEWWTPAGATSSRNVWKYISAVKSAC